ncbi:MAG: hypothetical protein JXB07_06490 [Anaerolineae bacterium]|nr:hypothetical protein [Anaerolineae bacterium]
MDNSSATDIRDTTPTGLYRVGAFAALIATFVFRRNLSAEMMVSQGFGIFSMPEVEPARAAEWFALLQRDWFVGLTLLGFFDLVEYAMVGLLFLALYGALRQIGRYTMVSALAIGLTGTAVAFASNQAFALLSLSHQHAAAATEAQGEMFLAAGEALLAVHEGAGSAISLFLVLLAGLLISIVMLRGSIFSRATAYTGILANGIALCYFITLPLGPGVYWLPPTLSAPFRLVWYFLIAWKLIQLRKDTHQHG